MYDADWGRLADYLDGRLPEGEAGEVERWLSSNPVRERLGRRLRTVWGATAKADTVAVDVRRLADAVRDRLNTIEHEATPGGLHRSGQLSTPLLPAGAERNARVPAFLNTAPRFRRVAFAIGAALCLPWAIWLGRGAAQPSMSPERVYRTAFGQRATVTLSDQSLITLAPGTTLRVSPGFGTHERLVSLEGEALFDVRVGPSAPFVVRTAGADIRVLGTTFNVARYAGQSRTAVAVTSGRVTVHPTTSTHRMRGTHTTTLVAGDIGFVTDDSTVSVTRNADVTPYTEWARGKLVFDNTPMPQVLATLSRWYGVGFRLSERDSAALVARHVTASFEGRSLSNALGTLKFLMQLDLTYRGDTVLVRNGNRRAPNERTRERRILPPHPTLNEVGR
jgi:transmembrane sensor